MIGRVRPEPIRDERVEGSVEERGSVMANVVGIGASIVGGVLAAGAIGAASGAGIERQRDDGFSARDIGITLAGTGVLGGLGVGAGVLLAGSQQARGAAMPLGAGMLVAGGAAAALAASYLVGWSLTN